MKKTLVMTIVLALLLSVVSVVSAATVATVDLTASEVKDGVATVTVKFNRALGASQFKLEYNKDLLTFDKVEGGISQPAGAEGDKTITTIAVPSIDTITVTFKVNGELPVDGTPVKFVPTANGFGTTTERGDVEVAENTVTIKAPVTVDPTEDPAPTGSVDPTEDPEPTQDVKPTEDVKPTGDAKPTEQPDKSGEVDGKDGKPGKYSQTGANVVAIALPVVAIITLAGVVLAKKEN